MLKSIRKGNMSLLAIAGIMSLSVLTACDPGAAAQSSGTPQAGVPTASVPEVQPPANANELKGLSGQILIDGSSTVYPITAAAAEEFNQYAANVRIPVGVSGTGGGFKM